MDSVRLQNRVGGTGLYVRTWDRSKTETTRAHSLTPQTAVADVLFTGRGGASRCKTRPLAVRPHSAVWTLLVPGLRSSVLLVDVVGPVGVPGLLGVAGALTASASPCTGAFSMYLCTEELTCRAMC
eukprot:17316-Amphidinium_carterae.1